MAGWQWLRELALPAEAEAKVVYTDPWLKDLDAQVQQGTVTPSVEGAPVVPTTMRSLQDVLTQAHAIPETARVHLRAPSPDPRLLGATYGPAPGAPRGNVNIAIRPYQDREAGKPEQAGTLAHELMHFLMLARGRQPGDERPQRHERVIAAMMANPEDKATLMRPLLQEEYPGMSLTDPRFQAEDTAGMRLLRTLVPTPGRR